MVGMASRRIRLIGAPIIVALLGGLGTRAHAGDWNYSVGISDEEQFTDNVGFAPDHTRSDLITSVSPSLAISGASTRLQGTLNYAPTIYEYALTPSEDAIGQSLYANETATVIPDTFFIDGRAYASLLPSTPGLSTGATGITAPTTANLALPSPGAPANQLSQAFGFNASPYLVHRFDDFGTAELRYTLSDVNIASPAVSPVAPAGTVAVSSRTVTNETTASFLTGENFGRLVSRLTLDGAQSQGSGVYNGANQLLAIDDMAYAVTKRIAALVTLGHEEINYNGLPPTHIDDMVWGAGLQLTPADGSSITAGYGHRNGATAPNASVVYNLSAITTLSASFTEGLTTTAQDIANNLAVSDVNQEGQLVDSRTLLPMAIANPALGLQSGVFLTRQFTGNAYVNLERNHFSATIIENESALVTRSAPGVGTSQNSTSATLNWGRDVAAQTTANLAVGYSLINVPGEGAAGQEALLSIGASISYMFSASLSGFAGCNRYERSSPDSALRLSADTIYAGLSKSF